MFPETGGEDKIDDVINGVKDGIRRTLEKRKRLPRSYPRQTKKRGKSYKNASVVKLRSLNWAASRDILSGK